MAVKGVDILILVNGVMVGGQRSATLSESVETIETTNKLSNGFKEFEYGFGEWKVSADGVYIKDDAGYEALKNAMRNKLKVTLRIQEEGQPVEEGQALVTSRDLEGAYDGEATYSVEFQGTGAITAL